MKCQDFMTKNPVFCLPEDTVLSAVKLMREKNIGALPVVDDGTKRRLTGIITDRDISIRVQGEGRDVAKTLIAPVMTPNPAFCQADSSHTSILEIMSSFHVRRLPVVNGAGELIGMVTQDDLLPYLNWYETKERRWQETASTAAMVGAGLCAAVGVGASLMYFFDPQKGRSRRNQYRDKIFSVWNHGVEAVEHTLGNLENRTEGKLAELRGKFVNHTPVPDGRLVGRVRTKLGRVIDHPHDVHVDAENGKVVISGVVPRNEVRRVATAVSAVPGVKSVDNRLVVH